MYCFIHVCGHEPTCMSLDSVTLLISMGLGVKAGAPSKDNYRREDIQYNAATIEFPLFSINTLYCKMCLCTETVCISTCMCTWLACDILLDLLWRQVGSPSLILSMFQPHDSMVFRDSLTDQQYNSLSCSNTYHLHISITSQYLIE